MNQIKEIYSKRRNIYYYNTGEKNISGFGFDIDIFASNGKYAFTLRSVGTFPNRSLVLQEAEDYIALNIRGSRFTPVTCVEWRNKSFEPPFSDSERIPNFTLPEDKIETMENIKLSAEETLKTLQEWNIVNSPHIRYFKSGRGSSGYNWTAYFFNSENKLQFGVRSKGNYLTGGIASEVAKKYISIRHPFTNFEFFIRIDYISTEYVEIPITTPDINPPFLMPF